MKHHSQSPRDSPKCLLFCSADWSKHKSILSKVYTEWDAVFGVECNIAGIHPYNKVNLARIVWPTLTPWNTDINLKPFEYPNMFTKNHTPTAFHKQAPPCEYTLKLKLLVINVLRNGHLIGVRGSRFKLAYLYMICMPYTIKCLDQGMQRQWSHEQP